MSNVDVPIWFLFFVLSIKTKLFSVLCLCICSGSQEGSLDRLLPSVSTGLSPRKRTTSQCKSEPPLLRTSKRTIYTAGRPPWYNEHGTQSKEAFVIGRKLPLVMFLPSLYMSVFVWNKSKAVGTFL